MYNAKFDWPEKIHDQANMNVAGHCVKRLSGYYFEPCPATYILFYVLVPYLYAILDTTIILHLIIMFMYLTILSAYTATVAS